MLLKIIARWQFPTLSQIVSGYKAEAFRSNWTNTVVRDTIFKKLSKQFNKKRMVIVLAPEKNRTENGQGKKQTG